ncbi:Non-specific serine/threonine protein [Salix suchowensis]|nr:Non-specific serine/threonine protein [Salix suchowensis]
MTEPDSTVNNLALLGLNQNDEFGNLTSECTASRISPFIAKPTNVKHLLLFIAFVTAAGFAAASILYNLPEPPFVHGAYTIAPFEIPRNSIGNGTVVTNTTAVKSESGCRPIQLPANRDGFRDDMLPFLLPLRCNVNVDIASQNLTQVTELRPFNPASSNFSDFAGNVTGAPLNGRAYNGIEFPFALNNPDRGETPFAYKCPRGSPSSESECAGLEGSFQADRFVQLSTQVYVSTNLLTCPDKQLLMSIIVIDDIPDAYCEGSVLLGYPNDRRPINVQIKQWVKRLFLRFGIASHVATCVFATNLGPLPLPSHWWSNSRGRTSFGQRSEKDISNVLRGKKFRIDPLTMKIIMEGEDGYEDASSPGLRRTRCFMDSNKGCG